MKSFSSLLVATVLLGACGDDGGSSGNTSAVVETYAANVYASYSDSVTTATALKTAVDAFTAAPSQITLDAAKKAWKDAREPYLQTEPYRFYDGPIDNPEDGPEGEINAWPMDEVFIDYVEGNPTSGIINNPTTFPTLTTQVIADQNENGGEANIATGYHAIEFLLWGQDLSTTGPGARPFTDYLTTGGTAANQERRKTYLKLVTDLLVADLTQVRDAWAPNAANYRADFVADKDAVQKIFLGMGSLSGAELSGERMTVALTNHDQEDEHSCFSDNTHRDLYGDALGLQNVFLGKYGSNDGEGLEDLIRAKNPALADKLKSEIASSITLIQAIPVPFDQAIADGNTAGQAKVQAAIEALQLQTETTVEAATALGITINLE
jgi:putative iron-regulated protein